MTIEQLETALLALLKGEHSSLSIDFNEDNGPNYQTVAEVVEDRGDDIHWVSDEERDKAVATNRMWGLQWYPDTPVGFHRIHASSLPALIDHILKQHAK